MEDMHYIVIDTDQLMEFQKQLDDGFYGFGIIAILHPFVLSSLRRWKPRAKKWPKLVMKLADLLP